MSLAHRPDKLTIIICCGVIPAAILITSKGRKNQGALWLAVILAVIGVCINRWVMVLQVLAAPVLTFEGWVPYYPSWQEIATTLLPVALGITMVALSYRYLAIFPQEQELNPITPEPAVEDGEDVQKSPPAEIAQEEPSDAVQGEPAKA